MMHFPAPNHTRLVGFLLSPTLALAMFAPNLMAETTLLNTIEVNDQQAQDKKNQMLKLKDSIVHTEVVTPKKIEQKQAASLAQAIENEPGVKVSTECSMCGVKRVMLNGLKGEHTTILTNGVANSSLMEGFYGFDAIPTAGVTSIEIARGAGASLIAPEAIGGVVNVVIDKPTQDKWSIDLSAGSNDYHKYQLAGTRLSKDRQTAIAVAAQSDYRGQVDTDHNQINESPELSNRALNVQVWHQINPNNQVDFRIEDQYSEVFGGPMLGSDLAKSKSDARTQPNGNANFEGGNVSNNPSSGTTARDFLENIITTKKAYTGKWKHNVSDDTDTQVTASYVNARLDSIYEGITYKADQDLYYVDTRMNHFINQENALTLGLDVKRDDYKTVSTGGSQPAGDSYQLRTNGLYVKNLWTPTNDWEISAALRADLIDVDFTEQNRSFDDTIFSPRIHLRYLHDFNWTSRFSAGQGYRAPLAFFETDHGIVDSPLIMAVDQLEKSNSFQYSLDFNGAQTDFETSYSWTAVDHLAMIDSSNPNNTRIVNSPDTGTVQHADISASHQLSAHWLVGFTAEVFNYDKAYRETFSVIPVEERIKFMANYEGHGWDWSTTLTWVGERSYSDYQSADYLNHYQDQANTESNGDHAPAYFTVDMKISKRLSNVWKVYAGATNLLDYTQTGDGSSPLFYDTNGDVDVTHIWGPLRGREIYAGIKADF